MSLEYKITFSNEAKKFIKKLDQKLTLRIIHAIELLKANPYESSNVKKMQGLEGNIYRLRVGNYRIIYEIMNEILVVHIIRLGTRGDIYKHI